MSAGTAIIDDVTRVYTQGSTVSLTPLANVWITVESGAFTSPQVYANAQEVKDAGYSVTEHTYRAAVAYFSALGANIPIDTNTVVLLYVVPYSIASSYRCSLNCLAGIDKPDFTRLIQQKTLNLILQQNGQSYAINIDVSQVTSIDLLVDAINIALKDYLIVAYVEKRQEHKMVKYSQPVVRTMAQLLANSRGRDFIQNAPQVQRRLVKSETEFVLRSLAPDSVETRFTITNADSAMDVLLLSESLFTSVGADPKIVTSLREFYKDYNYNTSLFVDVALTDSDATAVDGLMGEINADPYALQKMYHYAADTAAWYTTTPLPPSDITHSFVNSTAVYYDQVDSSKMQSGLSAIWHAGFYAAQSYLGENMYFYEALNQIVCSGVDKTLTLSTKQVNTLINNRINVYNFIEGDWRIPTAHVMSSLYNNISTPYINNIIATASRSLKVGWDREGVASDSSGKATVTASISTMLDRLVNNKVVVKPLPQNFDELKQMSNADIAQTLINN